MLDRNRGSQRGRGVAARGVSQLTHTIKNSGRVLARLNHALDGGADYPVKLIHARVWVIPVVCKPGLVERA